MRRNSLSGQPRNAETFRTKFAKRNISDIRWMAAGSSAICARFERRTTRVGRRSRGQLSRRTVQRHAEAKPNVESAKSSSIKTHLSRGFWSNA